MGISITTDWVAALQRECEEVIRIMTKVELKYPNVGDKYLIHSGRLYRVSEDRWRLDVPTDLRYNVVSLAHRELSHLGVKRLI